MSTKCCSLATAPPCTTQRSFGLTQGHEWQDAVERGVVEPEGHGEPQGDHESHGAGQDAGHRQVGAVLHAVALAQHEHGVEEHDLRACTLDSPQF